MPERIINDEQHVKVIDFIEDEDGFQIIEGDLQGTGAWNVNNETLAIYDDVELGGDELRLSCSYNHARDLTLKGIIDFPEEPQQDAKSG